MEIEYQWFTVEQSQSLFLKPSLSSEIVQTLKTSIKCAKNTIASDPISLLALSGNSVAGHISFTYGHVSTPEKTIRVAAASNLYTCTEFRGHGIGSALIEKSLEIGIPCFYTGISAQAMPLYKRLGFSFVDQSPIFQMPIGVKGILREWRNRLGSLNKADQQSFNGVSVFHKILSVRRAALRKAATSTLITLQEDSASLAINDLMKIRNNHFQVPWDKVEMIKASSGKSSKFKLLVFNNTHAKDKAAHFVTVYKKIDQVRLPRTSKQLDLVNGLVNEIYPPPTTLATAVDILCILTANARAMGFDNLSFCAMNSILENACQAMGLNAYHHKSIAIKPIGMEEDLAISILKPDNWWCRAMDEDFIEEAR